jgi:hypothetical protein
MAISLNAKKELRIVPIRFERAKTGDPDIAYPDIDDRGHLAKVPAVNGLAESKEIRGAVVGLTKDQEINIRLVREQIDPNATLFITSEDEATIKVLIPVDGAECPSGKDCIIKLKGGHFSGSTPKSTKIQVRFGAIDGPIISELTTYVFSRLLIFVQPHVVTINNPGGTGGVTPTMNVDDVMKQVKALWACCGLHFIVQPTKSVTTKLATANKMTLGEVNSVYANRGAWVSNTINVYVVQEIDGVLGYGFSKDSFAGLDLTHPGVFLGMKFSNLNINRTNDAYWCANDLAHEIGHFFTLWHPSDEPDLVKHDTWSMRLLMHNNNYTGRDNPPQNGASWSGYNDLGYGDTQGNPYRAGLISIKNVRTAAKAGIDGQCSTVRNHVAQGSSVLY